MEDVTFKEIFKYVLSKIIYVIIIVLLSIGLGTLYSLELKTPMYESNTTIVLTMVRDEEDAITTNDIELNKSLVSSYREIIKSKRIVKRVIKELKLDYDYEELYEMITVESVKDTELISINVQSKYRNETAVIANKLADVFGEEIVEIYNINNFKIVDEAEKADEAYNDNVVFDIIVAALIGLSFSIGIILVIFYFDTTVKGVEEIETKIGLPILGTIPVHSEKEGGKYQCKRN